MDRQTDIFGQTDRQGQKETFHSFNAVQGIRRRELPRLQGIGVRDWRWKTLHYQWMSAWVLLPEDHQWMVTVHSQE
jgi:hypothetical protein